MSGNGVTSEAVYQLLGLVAADLRDFRRETKAEFARVDGRIDRLTVEVQDIRSDVAGLRQVVGAYHATVLGHGILISELDDRVRRIEQHLNLPCTV